MRRRQSGRRALHPRSNEPLRAELLEERSMLAGAPELLGDLGEQIPISPGFEFVEAGGNVFFTGSISMPGERELWKTDGTIAGTSPVRDLHPSGDSGVTNLTELNGFIYFLANDQQGHIGLWKSDGTGGGTEFVTSMRQAFTSNTGVRTMVNAGGTLFSLVRGDFADELWRSDGTEAGTLLVNSLTWRVTTFKNIVAIGDSVYFETTTSGGINTLWVSDGTAAGTQQLKTFRGSTWGLESVGENVFFSAQGSSSSAGEELWKTDGSSSGTVPVTDIRPGVESSFPGAFSNQGGVLYFSANDGTNGAELWRSDGTAAGTYLVSDITAGSDSSSPKDFISLGGQTYFLTGNYPSQELWKTDGTGAGTELVRSLPAQYTAGFDGYLYLIDSTSNLARFNPADSQVETIAIGPFTSLQVLGEKLYLRRGSSLVISDGTSEGTLSVDAPVYRLTNSYASNFVDFNGATYFTAQVNNRRALYRDDGPGGLVRILGENPDGSGLSPYSLYGFAGALYFRTSGGSGKGDWWRSDGTVAGTHLAIDMAEIGSEIHHLIIDDNTMFFSMWNDGSQRLWRTDGTQGGTVNLAGYATELAHDGETLYFNGNGVGGIELWKSDGTVQGTVLVKDILPGPSSSGPWQLTAVGAQLYFVTANAEHKWELWTSDGTTVGTQKVGNQSGTSYFGAMAAVGDTLYLRATTNGIYGLWKVAGPGANLEPVHSFSVIVDGSDFGVLDDNLYFIASAPAGMGLWRSDGTTAGTVLIQALGPQSSIRRFIEVGRWLYFSVDDGAHGAEMWRTDGTAEGTELVSDLAPGALGSQPTLYPATSGGIYFVANDGVTGVDPWVIRHPHVVGRQLFYNNSKFDGGSTAAEAADDGAIATDKIAYVPGAGLSTTASVSSYSRGINGMMIDIENREDGALTANDFTFRIGTGNTPSSWSLAPAPLQVVVRAGEGVGGSDRVTITWADGAIKNTWLQVTVEGNDAAGGFNMNTSLDASEVFYFGSRVGDTFISAGLTSTSTTAQDELAARFNTGPNQPLTSIYDFNRDGIVSAADQLIARGNVGLLRMLDIDDDVAETLAAASAKGLVARSASARDFHAAIAFALSADDFAAEADDELTPVLARVRKR